MPTLPSLLARLALTLTAGLAAATVQAADAAGTATGTPDQTAPASGAIVIDKPVHQKTPEAMRDARPDERAAPGNRPSAPTGGSSPRRADDRYRSDMARCERLAGQERRDCTREAGAARAQGLYKD